MTVTRIEELSRSRCKIYLEDSFAFVLYKGELRLFGVREQEELSEVEQEFADEIEGKWILEI